MFCLHLRSLSSRDDDEVRVHVNAHMEQLCRLTEPPLQFVSLELESQCPTVSKVPAT